MEISSTKKKQIFSFYLDILYYYLFVFDTQLHEHIFCSCLLLLTKYIFNSFLSLRDFRIFRFTFVSKTDNISHFFKRFISSSLTSSNILEANIFEFLLYIFFILKKKPQKLWINYGFVL